MKAEAIPLIKLYDTHNKAYVIPNYQRPFAWSSNKAEELLDAILEDAKNKSSITALGTLLFCEIPSNNSSTFSNNTPTTLAPQTLWEVVDGQQRLTVFALIGFALNEKLEELRKNSFTYTAAEFEMLYSTSRTRKGASVPVLVRDGDNYDVDLKSDIASILDIFIKKTPYKDIDGRLKDAFLAIKKWISENLDDKNFNDFSDYFFTKCKVVQVLADDQDTAFTMFEPLNSTSEPLTAFEVYRSKVVRSLSLDFPKTESLLDYEKSKRDDVISRSNNLIFSIAQVYSGVRPRIHFLPLKIYLDNQVNKAFIEKLEESSEFFSDFWLDQKSTATWFDSEAKGYVRFIKAASHDASMPLILRYFLCKNGDNTKKVMKMVVAFYSLWRAFLPTNALPKVYRDLLDNGGVNNISVSSNSIKLIKDLAEYFRKILISKITSKPSPTSTQIRDDWKNKANLNYDDNKNICKLFIFVDIQKVFKINLIQEDPWKKADDIEHVYATSWATIQVENSIGNLTFLPPEINRSIQNSIIKDKFELYRMLSSANKVICPDNFSGSGNKIPDAVKKFLNDSNKPALMHLHSFNSYQTWGKTEIDARSDTILDNVWSVLYDEWLNP